MISTKITIGWVEQDFNGNGECSSQRFYSGDVEWVDENDNPITCPDDSWYHPFNMVQPTDKVILSCKDNEVCDGDCSTCDYVE